MWKLDTGPAQVGPDPISSFPLNVTMGTETPQLWPLTNQPEITCVKKDVKRNSFFLVSTFSILPSSIVHGHRTENGIKITRIIVAEYFMTVSILKLN